MLKRLELVGFKSFADKTRFDFAPGITCIVGPNEFLHIPMGKRVTACVARVIAEHHAASLRGETTGAAAVAGGDQHGEHGCC